MRSDRGPVFIAGHTKAGTTLVQALLDDHPELFVVPIELKFFKFPSLPSLPPGNMPPPPLPEKKTPIPREKVSIKQIKEEILSHADVHEILSGEKVSRGINISDSDFDRRKFYNVINNSKDESLRSLYVSFLKAFFEGVNDSRDIDDVLFVEKTPNIEEYAQELASWFPSGRFIHVMRDPYANIYSLQKARRRTVPLGGTYRAIAKSHYFMERNRRYIDRYKVVRYEDVVLDTRETMREVARHLGITYETTLETPTILGRPWGGNSRSTDDDFEGIDPRPVDAYRENISPLNIALVNKYFSTLIKKYNYDLIKEKPHKTWLPSGLELPYSYFLNRRLLLAN